MFLMVFRTTTQSSDDIGAADEHDEDADEHDEYAAQYDDVVSTKWREA